MNISNLSLPYPVLGISDDIIPLPESPVIQPVPNDPTDHIITLSLNTRNPYINNLIKEGKALYACEVECRKTFFRECFTSTENTFTLRFPRKSVSGSIVLTPTVVATQTIENYENPGVHEDYEGVTFNIDPGDLLCVFNQLDYFAEIQFDKLKAVSTFITILKTDKPLSYIDLDKPKIHLYLPEKLHSMYRSRICNQSQFVSSLHASLALNTLVYALTQIERYTDTKWAQTIKYRLTTEDAFNELDVTNPSDAIRIAQLLLGDPYERMFNDFISELD